MIFKQLAMVVNLFFKNQNKTTAAVCISSRVLKRKKYSFQDIHNFSFSDKIQEN